MQIRPSLPKDREKIKTLIAKYPKQLVQANLPKLKDFFVAEQGGEIIACCALEVYSKRLAEIRSLVVDKNFQGRLIASKLIKYCLKRAKKLGVYEVLSITAAVPLFEKQGFKTFNNEKYALLKMMNV
jgi:amino-acid N-acetyltransferase